MFCAYKFGGVAAGHVAYEFFFTQFHLMPRVLRVQVIFFVITKFSCYTFSRLLSVCNLYCLLCYLYSSYFLVILYLQYNGCKLRNGCNMPNGCILYLQYFLVIFTANGCKLPKFESVENEIRSELSCPLARKNIERNKQKQSAILSDILPD